MRTVELIEIPVGRAPGSWPRHFVRSGRAGWDEPGGQPYPCDEDWEPREASQIEPARASYLGRHRADAATIMALRAFGWRR